MGPESLEVGLPDLSASKFWAADGADSTGIFAAARGQASDTAYPALNTAAPQGTLTLPRRRKGKTDHALPVPLPSAATPSRQPHLTTPAAGAAPGAHHRRTRPAVHMTMTGDLR